MKNFRQLRELASTRLDKVYLIGMRGDSGGMRRDEEQETEGAAGPRRPAQETAEDADEQPESPADFPEVPNRDVGLGHTTDADAPPNTTGHTPDVPEPPD